MSKMLTMCIVVLSVVLTSGCSTRVGLFISANINPLKPYQLTLSDGYAATFYAIHKGDAEKTDALLFFVGGSGHSSHNFYLENYFEKLQGNLTIYALQKREESDSKNISRLRPCAERLRRCKSQRRVFSDCFYLVGREIRIM